MDTSFVSVVQTGDTTELQWGNGEPGEGYRGYAFLIDGVLYVRFNNGTEPYVFVLDGDNTRIVNTEDVPPAGGLVVWPFRSR